MKSNELRIGNVVNYLNSAYPIKSWQELKVIDEYIQDGNGGDFTGIPLTAELLEKCGFVLKDRPGGSDYTYYSHSELKKNILIRVDVFTGRIGVSIWIGAHSISLMEDIKYLHQLQNLFYALCGEELTIRF